MSDRASFSFQTYTAIITNNNGIFIVSRMFIPYNLPKIFYNDQCFISKCT